ncbi:MAG: DUF1257 domain-containing protein [Kiritimatiellae bacterium]|nr:DUF1257 domain-containing protein [Kiritimatiellia bacterium]
MSHFTTVETQVRDIGALRKACTEMGLVLASETEARGYGSNTLRGEYVIRLKGPYDIALNREHTGSYGLTTDWWDGHVEREVGHGYGRLLQLYAVHKTQIKAKRKGYTCRRTKLADGSVKLVLGGV